MRRTHTSSNPDEIAELKSELHARGYRLAQHTSEKDLQPKEYIERQFRGSENFFQGRLQTTLVWIDD